MQILTKWLSQRKTRPSQIADRLPAGISKKAKIQDEYGIILAAARSLNLDCHISYCRKRISSLYITIPAGGYDAPNIWWRFSDHVVPLTDARKRKRAGHTNLLRRKPHLFVEGKNSYFWWKSNLRRMLAGEAPVK